MKQYLIILVILLSVRQLSAQEETINIASYNIRNKNTHDGDNSWSFRKEQVKALIRYHEFDIFGIQEGKIDQLNDLLELNEYKYVGKGRDDGRNGGEHCAIFFRKNRFKVIDKGDFWFSETPHKPSLGWDAVCIRICSWIKLKEITTNKEFFVFNSHTDHKGEKARIESSKLLIKNIQQIAGKLPVFCLGDLNSKPDSKEIIIIKTLLSDSYKQSKMQPYGPVGTYNGFDTYSSLAKRIDYIFTSKEIDVLKYGALTDWFDQKYPSDHLPIVVKAKIN